MSKKTFTILLIILIAVFVLTAALFVSYFFDDRQNNVNQGQITINKDIESSFSQSLQGQWLFYPKEIITKRSQISDKSYENYIKAPSPWNILMYARKYPAEFSGTYYCKLNFPKELVGKKLSILVSGLVPNGRVYIDGKQIYGLEDIDNKDIFISKDIVEFTVESTEHELFIPIINDNISDEGGIIHKLFIGTQRRIFFIDFLTNKLQYVLMGMAGLLVIFYLIQVILKRKNIWLNFNMASLMILIIVKLLFNQNFLIFDIVAEISYAAVYRINYISSLFIFYLIYLISNSFYGYNKRKKIRTRFLGIFCILVTTLIIIFPKEILYKYNNVLILLIVIIGIMTMIDSMRAYLRKKVGGLLFFSSLTVIATSFIYDELIFDRIFSSVYFTPGALFFVTIMIFYLEISMYEEYAEKNVQLYEDKEKLSYDIISAMVFALDARDEYTQGHSIRVKDYSLGIGKELNLSQNQMEKLEYMALLHDVGKIGISDNILRKPENLSEEEYRKITRHTLIGEKILSQVDSLSEFIDGVKYHHERFDGTGYPSGLRGKHIPLYARIIAVADSYDAMMSNRDYAEKRTQNQALEEIKNNSGILYDPEVVDAFIRYMTRVKIK